MRPPQQITHINKLVWLEIEIDGPLLLRTGFGPLVVVVFVLSLASKRIFLGAGRRRRAIVS